MIPHIVFNSIIETNGCAVIYIDYFNVSKLEMSRRNFGQIKRNILPVGLNGIYYSNATATGSSVINEYILSRFDKIDFGGLLTLMKRLFSDVEFIYDIKYEFIKSGLEELL